MKHLYTFAVAMFLFSLGQNTYAQMSVDDPDDFVDLGLPSGSLWAQKNLGATAPEEAGDYFQWGETITRDRCEWESYPYAAFNGDLDIIPLLKYNNNPIYGEVDNKMILDLEDDAAYKRLGGDWHMPTTAECQEMVDGCTWSVDSVDGTDPNYGTAIKMLIFKGVSKANGNTIIFPCAGNKGIMINKPHWWIYGSHGMYWTSEVTDSMCPAAQYLSFGTVNRQYATEPFIRKDRDRSLGMPVRAIKTVVNNIENTFLATRDDKQDIVFDLTGKQVDPKSLKSGLYVRGGKKIFIKK